MSFIKKIFRTHIEWVLIAIGVVFVIAIGWTLIWGVTILAQDLGTSLGAPQSQYATEKFDLKAASELDLRGLE